MSRRNKHVGKSPANREAYSRYIRKLDLEPTVDYALPLSPSSESGEELREPTSKAKRKADVGQVIKSYVSDNWVGWLVGIVIFILFFLTVESKVNIAVLLSSVESIKGHILDINSVEKEQSSADREQDLTLREHSVKIEQLQQDIERNNRGSLLDKNKKSVP